MTFSIDGQLEVRMNESNFTRFLIGGDRYQPSTWEGLADIGKSNVLKICLCASPQAWTA